MIIQSRYSGTCCRCGGPIAIGTWISWTRGVGASHVDRATCADHEAAPQAPKVAIDLAPVAAFLNAAKARGLKFPKAAFLAPEGGELLVYVAGERSRVPGAIQVKVDGEWMGRVNPDGEVVGPRLLERQDLQATLAAIAADPVTAAKAYGALRGRCSFCSLPLTDEGSIEVGYGPVCAKRWGLPHKAKGSKALRVLPLESVAC